VHPLGLTFFAGTEHTSSAEEATDAKRFVIGTVVGGIVLDLFGTAAVGALPSRRN
jgi:hypothetical protein